MSDEYFGTQENQNPVTEDNAPVGEGNFTANDAGTPADNSFAVSNDGEPKQVAEPNSAAENNAASPAVDTVVTPDTNNNMNNNYNLNNNSNNNFNNANNNSNNGFYNTNGVQAYAPVHHINQNVEEPLSTGEWALTLIIQMIPLVGLIMTIVWACGAGHNTGRRNFARALLIIRIVALVLVVFFVAVVIIAATAMGYQLRFPF